MPRLDLIQTNFTAGEFSPRLYGRVDIARYNNAVRKMENAYPLIFGGAKNRDGTLIVSNAKFDDSLTILVPFSYNALQTYILEFGHLYMRVYRNKAQVESSPGVAYEISTPFTSAMLRQMDFQQAADTMIIEHESIYPQRLRRFGDASWQLGNAPIVVEPFDEIGLFPAADLTLSSAAVGAGVTATAASAQFLASDVGRFITFGGGTAVITAFTSTTVVTVEIKTAFSSTTLVSSTWNIDSSPQTQLTPSAATVVGTQINLTLAANGWRASDVGKYVKINGGLVLINGFTSATIVTGIIKEALQTAAAAPALAWSLNSSIWGNGFGYPRTGLLHEQRLFLAGSTRYPQYLAGSQTGNLFNFQLGTSDDDGFLFKIAQSQDQITHLSQVRQMLSFGASGIFSINGGVEKPIAPTNVQINSQSEDGSSDVRPVRVGNEIYFVGRSTKRLFAAAFDLNLDGFAVTDVSKIADHISGLGMVDVSYQRDPNQLLSIVLNNGDLATVTIDRDENVTGWAKHTTDGEFESIATIPIDGSMQTWVVVRRLINGVTKRYIEVFEPDMYLDSAIIGTSVGGSAAWFNLDHLEGKSVGVLADGVVMGEFTVSGGSITLPRTANNVVIGLPYTTTIELLPIEIASQTGSSQGSNVRTGSASIKLLNSIGCKVNDTQVPFRKFGPDVLNEAVQPFTGIIKENLLGWATDEAGVIKIVQEQPLPLHVQSVVRRVAVND